MKNILLILFLFGSIAYSQNLNKYLVYFKDKGIDRSTTLSKSSEEYQIALNSLSQKSIDRRKKVLDEDIISFEDLPVNKDYIQDLELLGAEIIWELKWFNAVSCLITQNEVQQIQKLSFVDKIEKVKTLRYNKKNNDENLLGKVKTASDNSYNLDYGFSLTQNELSDVPAIHDLGFSGEDVLIGLLDAGFAWREHTSLRDAEVIAEYDFVYGDSLTDDGDASHGTAVFSIIGGFDEGWLIGPAYNAKYILAKTENINSETHVEEDNYAAALEWMEALGVDITSSSLGYNEFDEGEESYTYKDMDGKTTIITQASEIAFTKGILTVTSAGNEGNKSWKYILAPADGFNTLSVGAVNSVNDIAAFSSFGPTYDNRIKPEIVTQGVSCYHAKAYTENYGFGLGTSFAAPIASGIAAQLLSAFPYLKNTQMRRIIMESGDNPEEPDNSRGYGLLSAKRVLEYPNLKEVNSSYVLNKMFIDEIIGENDSVYVEIYEDSSDYIPVIPMQKENDYYSVVLPIYPDSTLLKISFSIVSSDGKNSYFSQDLYEFFYGSLDIFRYTFEIPPPEPSEKPIFYVYQNYKNPFITNISSNTTIKVEIPKPSDIKLEIYDILGREVKTIFYDNKPVGEHYLIWNGNDNYGSRVSSGVYIYRVTISGNSAARKMILLN